ncbi:MAG TPA: ATP synthase F1 subunit delta, partial [Candidatus Caenarcaniphilales bacterium]
MSRSSFTAEIVEPYAEALMSLAQAHDLSGRFGEDMSALLSVLSQSPELQHFLSNPLPEAEVKKGVLRQVMGEQVHPYVLSFLMLLIDRRRIFFLEGICKQYQALLRELNHTVLAEVVSTVELTDGQRQTVTQKVKQMSGAERVELEARIDPDLIGGVVIKV